MRNAAISNPFTVYPHTLSPIADRPFTYASRNFHRIRKEKKPLSYTTFPFLGKLFGRRCVSFDGAALLWYHIEQLKKGVCPVCGMAEIKVS